MKVDILGAESLGVRSMCCMVETGSRLVLIDPGVALAPWRFGLPPHQSEKKRAAEIREEILKAAKRATDIVISHFHGDHAPLTEPDPNQIPLRDFINRLGSARVWIKSRQGNTKLMDSRYLSFVQRLGERAVDADGRDEGDIAFSLPVVHGQKGRGKVMMTRVKDAGQVFVFGSDIQLFDDTTIDMILTWHPDIVFVDGPPIYLSGQNSVMIEKALANGLRLAKRVDRLIIDHHLLRSATGLKWLERLIEESRGRVVAAADWQGRVLQLLEAQRRHLFSSS